MVNRTRYADLNTHVTHEQLAELRAVAELRQVSQSVIVRYALAQVLPRLRATAGDAPGVPAPDASAPGELPDVAAKAS